MAAEHCDHLSEIADQYEGFIIDLWGVIHNGIKAYPAANACLKTLREAGKTICFLSNAPRRLGSIVQKLDGMGVTIYDHLMSSGESTFEALNTAPPGKNCLHIGPERDNDIFTELSTVQRVTHPKDADFVVLTGPDLHEDTLQDYWEILDSCHAHTLPLICANPDRFVMIGDKRVLCAGEMARYYEENGGVVTWYGKPHVAVYHRCFELMNITDTTRILAIGDNVATDIAGAEKAGIDSVLIRGTGIGDQSSVFTSQYVMQALRW